MLFFFFHKRKRKEKIKRLTSTNSFFKRNFKTSFFKTFFLNYVWTWYSMRIVHRQPFQRPGHNHPKKKLHFKKVDFLKLHFSKLFFQTTSGPNPLWERYTGNLFIVPVTITQKETSFQNLKKKISKNLFSTYVWTWSSIREVHRQPFQRPDHNHSK